MNLVLTSNNFIYKNVLVLPLIGYWLFSYGLFNFGPFETPQITAFTHIYFVIYLSLFYVSYVFAAKTLKFKYKASVVSVSKVVNRYKIFASISVLGSMLLLLDRYINVGVGVDQLTSDLGSVREIVSQRLTWLTTLGAVLMSFKIIAIGSYIYLVRINQGFLKKYCAPILAMVTVELLLMFGNASRGALFWWGMYSVFLLVYGLRINPLKLVFSYEYALYKTAFLIFCTLSLWYFSWVAENRETTDYASIMGMQAYELLKYPSDYADVSFQTLGGVYSLFYYVTHGFQYLDAIIQKGSIINLDLLSPTGIRMEAQIARFFDYRHPAKQILEDIYISSSLNDSGWPTLFGASIVFFGLVGALFFSVVLGVITGSVLLFFDNYKTYGGMILMFCIYYSYCLSFDWIFRDFEQFAALFYGIFQVFVPKWKVVASEYNSNC